MYKEKQYVLAGYQERRYNYYAELWGEWYECNSAQYNYIKNLKDVANPMETQVREIYALED